EVPRRLDEGVHRVRLAATRAAATRAPGTDERLVAREWRAAGPRERDVLGQHHRQIAFRDRHRTAAVAVDGRDGRAPVALAGDTPVAEAVRHRLPALAARRERPRDALLRRLALEAGELTRIDESPRTLPGPLHRRGIEGPVVGLDDDPDR